MSSLEASLGLRPKKLYSRRVTGGEGSDPLEFHRQVNTRATARIKPVLVLVFAFFANSSALLADTPGDSALPFTSDDRNYWMLQPVVRPEVPEVQDAEWVRNPIDAFILARLEEKGLSPAPEADRNTLLRRASFDLLGLPPTSQESDAFLADASTEVYEHRIDSFLASPHYGEAWARHWLDLVRYAETDGFKADVTRPGAWRYRDWVIKSLNDDKPYDRFVTEQIAGDEMAPNSHEALIATGFLRHGPYEDNQAHVEQQWHSILNDVTNVTGQVFLGVTIGCARCHDHKYDPILQKDYYRLQAFFAALDPRAGVPIAGADEQARYQSRFAEWEESTREVRARMEALEAPHREKFLAARLGRFPKEVQAILALEPAERTPYQAQIAALARRQLVATPSAMRKLMKGEEGNRWDALREELEKWDDLRPETMPVALAVRDIGPKASPVRIPGNSDKDGSNSGIEPGFLSILDPRPAEIDGKTTNRTSTGRRTALARWITRPENPLTARVMVNRLWQFHFGRGLVATPNDFGRQGGPPTHPELLDWLASEFVASGWSLKAMHRLMVTSATYRQVSRVDSSHQSAEARVDPENKLLWKMRMRRLEGEELRDAILATSGELNLEVGGPSIYPDLPPGLSARYAWKASADLAERNRRSIYIFLKRNLRYPLFEAFDMPDTHESCARRNVTTTAPQALLLLNGRMGLERAAAFTGRLLRESSGSDRARIRRAYRLAFNRSVSENEIIEAEAFLDAQTKLISGRMEAGERVTLPRGTTVASDSARSAALVDFCHVLMNSNEFIYVD